MHNTAVETPAAGEPAPLMVYGLPQCGSVRKARAWLVAQGQPHRFHDFKKAGVPADGLRQWVHQLGWQALVNRQGSTWRQLDAAQQAAVVDADSACALMLAHPSVIKRPLIAWPDGRFSVGVDEALFARRLAAGAAAGP